MDCRLFCPFWLASFPIELKRFHAATLFQHENIMKKNLIHPLEKFVGQFGNTQRQFPEIVWQVTGCWGPDSQMG